MAAEPTENEAHGFPTEDDTILNMVHEDEMADVLSLVAQHESNLISCDGKNVVMFLGATSAGKSVTINSLLFGPLIKKKVKGSLSFEIPVCAPVVADDGKKSSVASSSSTQMRAAKVGNGLVSCTKLPSVYELDSSTTLFDTRGFFDATQTPNEEAASSVLLDMTLKRARSIKIVVLIRYEDFAKGLIGMKALGEVFGKIVKDEDVSILFLINNYRPDYDEVQAMTQMSPAERQSYILTQIKEKFELIEEEAKVVLEDYQKRVSGKIVNFLGISDPDKMTKEQAERAGKIMKSDEKYREVEESSRYLHVMSLAMKGEKGAVGYIDPTDPYSVRALRESIEKLNSIPFRYLTFSSYNKDIEEFRRYLADSLGKFSCLLSAKELLQMYPRVFVVAAIEWRKQQSERHAAVLEAIEKEGEAAVERYQNEYNVEVFSEQATRYEKERTDLLQAINKIEEDIKNIKKQPNVEYDRDSWRIRGQHPEHTVYYRKGEDPQKKIPFVDWKKTCGEKTEYTVISEKPSDFEVQFYAGSKGRSIGVNVGHVAAGIAFGLIGAGIYAAIRAATAVACEGEVIFYIKAEDTPENAGLIKEMNARVSDLKAKAAELEEKRDTALKAAAEAGLKERVTALKSNVEEEIRSLEEFLDFEAKVEQLFRLRGKDAKNYICVIGRLFSGNVYYNNVISAGNVVFEREERIKSNPLFACVGQGSPEQPIRFSDLNTVNLAQQLKENFPTFK